MHSPSALTPSCKFKVKRTILTKIKHIIYTPTSKDGDPNMNGTIYNSNNGKFTLVHVMGNFNEPKIYS